jgi:nitrite reductase/ring-hydroxylating ferredoxin subunit
MTSVDVKVRPVDPRPPYPLGWFHVAWSDDVAPGGIVERTFMGDQIVVFRTEGGEVVAAPAHCPHLGANLARGGTVIGESLRCPFHSLRWGTDGTCDASDYPGDPAYPGTLAVFPMIERFGGVFAWHDPSGGEPTFDIPDLELEGWTPFQRTTIPIRAHVETIHENGVDFVHFEAVHGFALSGCSVEERGDTFHSEFHFAVPGFLRDGPAEIVTLFDTDVFGLGYARSINSADDVGLRYRVLLLPTPTSGGYVDFTIATSVQRPPTGDTIAGTPVDDVADVMHAGAVGGVRQDIPIWEGLRYVERPRLVKGDGPIPRLRHWATRFHPEPAPAGTEAPA